MKNTINVTNTSNVKTYTVSCLFVNHYNTQLGTINAYIGMIWMNILFSLLKRASFISDIFLQLLFKYM